LNEEFRIEKGCKKRMRFKGMVVLITGAGRGLGRGISLAFGLEGARLAINDLTPVNLDETEELLLDMGTDCLCVNCDISKKAQVQGMLESILDHYGRLDILVNNAGVEPTSSLMTMDEWDWDRTVAVNLKGPFLTMQSAARIMKDQGGGMIVNIGAGSLQGEYLANRPAYAASKEGLMALTRAAAIELAPHHIRVNMVAPGHIRQFHLGNELDHSPRYAAVAEAVLYLCSKEAKFITGEVISMMGNTEVD
jgi:NAD(P)-dependent dehydrogenase (short-subunit alcohol dehydrogenase family)